jgi:hypothetical protein
LITTAVLIHQPRQQFLIEAAPIDADAHWALVPARDLDHLSEVVIAAGAAPHVAWINPVLGQRLSAVRKLSQQLVTIEVEVPDQRHMDPAAVEHLAQISHFARRIG